MLLLIEHSPAHTHTHTQTWRILARNTNAIANRIIHTIHYGQHQAEGILCLVCIGQIDNEG